MEFTFVDGAVALIIILSGVLAYSRGLTREIFAIGGWIVAALAAFYLTPIVEPLMHEIPGVGDFFASSCVISTIAAFTLIVALCLLILSVFTPLFSTLLIDSAFGLLDKMLGFVFGVARGILLVAVAYLIFTNLSAEESVAELENAGTKSLLEESAALIEANLPEGVPDWFGDRIDALMGPCAGGSLPSITGSDDDAGAAEVPQVGNGTAN